MLDDPIPALKLRLATEILSAVDYLNHYIASQVLGIGQPRLSDLGRGRHHRFSVERLIRLLAVIDRRVDVTIVNTGPQRLEWLRILRSRRLLR